MQANEKQSISPGAQRTACLIERPNEIYVMGQ